MVPSGSRLSMAFGFVLLLAAGALASTNVSSVPGAQAPPGNLPVHSPVVIPNERFDWGEASPGTPGTVRPSAAAAGTRNEPASAVFLLPTPGPSNRIYLPLIARGACSPPLPMPTLGIVNGDFESGPTGWTEYSLLGYSLIERASDLPHPTHSGCWAVWQGGNSNEKSYIQQQVTVPVGNAYLGYWHWIESDDETCGHDFGGVKVNGTVVDQYDLCRAAETNGWVKHVVNLGTYAGQSISLQIWLETDPSYLSDLYVDDVAFQSGASFGADELVTVAPDRATPNPGDTAPTAHKRGPAP